MAGGRAALLLAAGATAVTAALRARALGTRRKVPAGRRFDPVAVAGWECAAWAAYYRREWVRVLVAAVGMVAAGFGMGPGRTLAGAWHVLRANQAWAPYPDNDPGGAREHMRRFYELVAESGRPYLDPARVARLEVEWWRVHRLHQHGDAVGAGELTDALDALSAAVYGIAAGTAREAARLRMQAMELSDRWVEAGCDRQDPLLVQVRWALVASYTELLAATSQR